MEYVELYCPACKHGWRFPDRPDKANARCPIHMGRLSMPTGFGTTGKKKRKGYKINPKTRRKVYKRDGFTCVRCGESDRSKLSVDHIVKREHGGGNAAENLRTMCVSCNSSRDHWERLGKFMNLSTD